MADSNLIVSPFEILTIVPAGLPLIFYFEIPWLFNDFSLTFHHFPAFYDGSSHYQIIQDSPFISLITEQLAHSSVFFSITACNLKNSILVKQSGMKRNSENLNII